MLVKEIDRDDVPEAFVDTIDTIMSLTDDGVMHGCAGHSFALNADCIYICLLLIGEALPWASDPEEMRREPFYRLKGFVIDRHWRRDAVSAESCRNRQLQLYTVNSVSVRLHSDAIRIISIQRGYIGSMVSEGRLQRPEMMFIS